MSRLKDKVAVITGGGTGIGLATAKRFVAEGAQVFIAGRREEELTRASALIGKNVTSVACDVTSAGDLMRLYERVKDTKGHIDILFANAGGGGRTVFGDTTQERFDAIFNLNARGVYFTVQYALPLLRDGASIILTGSMASAKGLAGLGVYAAAKAAVRSFARTWAVELKQRRIRTNVLSPGPVETPLLAGAPAEAVDYLVSLVPLARLATAEEMASVALFLASDESSYVTGTELFADGGAAQV
jgi:NAD(P)-dependent dehydrogenase (short-subunit alcohol dehydrogenase family)